MAGNLQWRLFCQASEIWAAAEEDCAGARDRIDIEQFILGDDRVGQGVCSLLEAKAREGVRVRILADGFGSSDLLASDAATELRNAGAEIHPYNPLWRRPLVGLRRQIRRDHRKILIADDVAYVGSACFEERMADWRELTIRLTGAIVEDIGKSFDANWRTAEKGGRRSPPPAGDFDIEYIENGRGRRNWIYRRVLQEIADARIHVRLCSPYLLPDARFFKALRSARERGAQVTAIVPSRIDTIFVDSVGWSYYGRLLAMGCTLFLYQPVELHAKAVAVDGRWATLGSMNLDRLSFHLNLEGNISTTRPDIVSAIEKELDAMAEASKEVKHKDWQARPFYRKLLGALGRPLAPLL